MTLSIRRIVTLTLAALLSSASEVRAQCPSATATRLRASDDPAGVAPLASAAMKGEWAVVSRNGGGGVPAAAIFLRKVAGTWMEHQIVLPIGPIALEHFGSGRAEIAGDVAVIGSTTAVAGQPGSAYVFRRVGTVWAQEAQLVSPDGISGLGFGGYVATDGARVIVGAIGGGSADLGAAYFFVHTGGGWLPEQKVMQPGTVDIHGFGGTVRIAGSTAFVGESIPKIGGSPAYGKVHVYHHDGVAWALQTSLLAPSPVPGDQFGQGFDFDGTTLAVTFPGGFITSGPRVVLFTESGGAWSPAGTLTGAATWTSAIAIDGSLAAFGDPSVNVLDDDSGAILVYEKQAASSTWIAKSPLFDTDSGDKSESPTTLDLAGDTILATSDEHADAMLFSATKPEVEAFETQLQKIVPATSPSGDGLEATIASDGDHLLVGLRNDATNGAKSGAVYAYRRAGGVWNNEVKLTGAETGGLYGNAVAVEGDLAMIGARKENGGAGRVHVLEWNGSSWNEVQVLDYPFPTPYEFGSSIAIEGAVAVIGADGPLNYKGQALVYEKQGASWVFTQLLAPTLVAPQSAGEIGADVAISGDTILLGAPYTWTPLAQAGGAFVYRKSGAATSWTLEAALIPSDPAYLGHFGTSVALDGDHAWIGAPKGGLPLDAPPGRAYAWTRTGTTWTETQIVASNQLGTHSFGADVAMRGGDAVVGCSGYFMCGAVHQFRLINGTWQRVQRFHRAAAVGSDGLGASVALNGSSIFAFERAFATIGAVDVYSVAKLALYSFFNHPAAGEPLSLTTTGGVPGAGGMLFITAVGGTPFLIPLVPATFDSAGAFSLDVIVPPVAGLAGLALDFQSYTLSGSGAVIGSNKRTVTFD